MPVSHRKDAFAYENLERSDFIHGLVNGLRIQLTECRRVGVGGLPPDRFHFDFVMSLYSCETLRECIAAARAHYPVYPCSYPHYTLTMAHGRRRLINAQENKRIAWRHGITVEIEPPMIKQSMTNLPQTMIMWPGIKLLACVKDSTKDKNIINGMEYEVLAFTDTDVTLRKLHPALPAKNAEPFTLTHDDCALQMRLQHALCYYSTQGRTLIDGRIRLMDTDHAFFTKRHLIVGLSRTRRGSDVEIK